MTLRFRAIELPLRSGDHHWGCSIVTQARCHKTALTPHLWASCNTCYIFHHLKSQILNTIIIIVCTPLSQIQSFALCSSWVCVDTTEAVHYVPQILWARGGQSKFTFCWQWPCCIVSKLYSPPTVSLNASTVNQTASSSPSSATLGAILIGCVLALQDKRLHVRPFHSRTIVIMQTVTVFYYPLIFLK